MNERLNIRRMQVPEAGKDFPTFDPEEDISARDWRAISAFCSNSIGSKERLERWRLPHLFYPAMLLKPDLPVLKDSRGMHLKLVMDVPFSMNEWTNYLESVAFNKATGNDTGISREDWRELREEYIVGLRDGDVINHMAHAIALAYTVDNSVSLLVDGDAEDMQEQLEEYRRSVVMWDAVAEIAADMRVLGIAYPPFSKTEWQNMRSYLEGRRQNNQWEDFLQQAAAMKILAAEDVDVTDEGIKMQMPKYKDAEDSIPPTPETLAI